MMLTVHGRCSNTECEENHKMVLSGRTPVADPFYGRCCGSAAAATNAAAATAAAAAAALLLHTAWV